MSAAAWLLGLSVTTFAADGVRLETRVVEGEVVCSLRARDVAARDIARALATVAQREISGLESPDLDRVIDVEFAERSWIDALERVLGAAGVRARIGASITIEGDLEGAVTNDEVAESRYRAALRAFPDHTFSADARLVLGRLLDRRGEHRAARETWEVIPTRNPGSKAVARAWRAISESALAEGDDDDAARALSKLGGLVDRHGHHAFARRELARLFARRGSGDIALSTLEALDASDPTTDTSEVLARSLARAEALVVAKRPGEALSIISRSLGAASDLTLALDFERARGEALAQLGRASEASLSWLFVADATDDKRAFARAARLALDAHDGMGALAIVRAGEERCADAALAALGLEALQVLGLDGDRHDEVSRRLLSLRLALDLNDLESARSLAQSLADEELPDDLRWQRDALNAHLVELSTGVEPALDVIRRALSRTRTEQHRRDLYLAAASILERHRMFERAADALAGEF